MNAKQLEKLKRLQAKGKKHYIWHRGVIGWGLITGILWSLWMTFISFFPFTIRHFDLFVFLRYFGCLPIWLAGGYFFGELTWSDINRKLSQK